MTEMTFAQRWAGESRRLPYWEAGAGETIVAILDGERLPTRAHALLAERRRRYRLRDDSGRWVAAGGSTTSRRRGGGAGDRAL